MFLCTSVSKHAHFIYILVCIETQEEFTGCVKILIRNPQRKVVELNQLENYHPSLPRTLRGLGQQRCGSSVFPRTPVAFSQGKTLLGKFFQRQDTLATECSYLLHSFFPTSQNLGIPAEFNFARKIGMGGNHV